eukprot:4764261-Amphidinium_carterae.1
MPMALTLQTNSSGLGVPVLPPMRITIRDLRFDAQWASWRNPRTYEQSMTRVRALGLPAHVKARIAKSLHSVGLYGAEVGGIPAQGMAKLCQRQMCAWEGSGPAQVCHPWWACCRPSSVG